METRRQKKVSRSIKEAVSDAIHNHLSDPRIEGFISVTKVDVAPNLKNASVFLSIFGSDEKAQKRTFLAIEHATSKIQSYLANRLTTKFCPSLHFKMDEELKKTMETMDIINKIELEQASDEQEDPSSKSEEDQL